MSTPLRQRQNPDVPWVGYPIGSNRRVLIADSANPKKVKWDWLQVGGAAANRIQLHDHADPGDAESDDGFIHFLSPEPEQQYHGNLFQETIGTSGARQAQMSLYPSQWSLRQSSQITLRSESVDGVVKPSVNISAGSNGRIDLVAGSAVTGPLGYDPTDANHLTRKAWVDSQISTVTGNANNRVLRAGDSMTGALFAPEFRTGRDTYQKIRIEDAGTHAAIRFDSPDSNEGITGYLLQEMSGTFQHVLSLSPSKYNLGSVPYIALWSSTVDNATKGKVVLEAAGGTVTIGAGGPIEGPGFDPTLANHLTDKEWVDGQVATVTTNANSRVLRAGDTMNGRLIGPSLDPAFADEYTRQTYVMGLHNQNVRLAGSTMTGMLTLPNSDPTLANHATRKQYVDNLVAGYGYVLKTGDTMTGSLDITAEGTRLSVDAGGLRRLGLVKKSGANPMFAYAGIDIVWATSSGTAIDATNTFTERLRLSQVGNLTAAGNCRAKGLASTGNVNPSGGDYHVREFLFDGADSGTNSLKSNGTGGSSISFDHNSSAGLWTWRNDSLGTNGPVERMSLSAGGNLTISGNYFYGASGFRMGEIYGHRGLYTESTNMRFDVGLLNGEFQFSYQGSIKSTMSKTGDWWANAFTVGISGEQRIEMHRHDGASYIHFYAPGETFHGNIYQDFVGTAGTTRQARLLIYPSTMGSSTPEIRLLSRSENGSIGRQMFVIADGSNMQGTLFAHDPASDVGLRIDAGSVDALNNAATAYRPMKASAFTVSSDPAIKRSIRDVPYDELTEGLRNARVIKHRMKKLYDDGTGQEYIGMDATTMPSLVQRKMTAGPDSINGYDVASALAWLWGSVSGVERRLASLEAK